MSGEQFAHSRCAISTLTGSRFSCWCAPASALRGNAVLAIALGVAKVFPIMYIDVCSRLLKTVWASKLPMEPGWVHFFHS